MTLDASGRLAIGSTSVTNGTAFGGGSQVNVAKIASSGYPCFQISTTSGGGTSLQFTNSDTVNGVIGYNASGGTNEFVINNVLSGNLVFNTNNTERARIDSSGNLLIARTSGAGDGSILKISQEAAGDLSSTTVTRANASGVYVDDGATPASNRGNGIWFDSGSLMAGIASARVNTGNWGTDLRFYTHPDTTTNSGETYERARIDSSGNLLVGKTSNVFATVGTSIQQDGSVTLTKTHGDSGGAVMYINRLNVNGAAVFFYKDSTEVGNISVTASATAYNTSSDYRLKENVQPMTGALATVTALKPVTFNWKSDGSDGQGFIAHELQAVVPDCVTGEKDAVNEDGSIKSQGIDTSFLVATLTAAIQEQQALITSLTERITALEGV
jgi:hypothetical protein